MAIKARYFHDAWREAAIMETDDPKVMKRIGRQITAFNQDIWDEISGDVMKHVCEAKFRSSPELHDALLATSGTVLVECSPWDYRWGIRLDIRDPRANRHQTWLGANRLGFILSKIRETLIRERGKVPYDCLGASCHECNYSPPTPIVH